MLGSGAETDPALNADGCFSALLPHLVIHLYVHTTSYETAALLGRAPDATDVSPGQEAPPQEGKLSKAGKLGGLQWDPRGPGQHAPSFSDAVCRTFEGQAPEVSRTEQQKTQSD